MSRKPSGKADPLEVEIELALNPGAFIPDRACFSFAIDLGGVAAKISKLAITDPARAMALYEAFLAGCYEKADELDDSSGWFEARQAAGADPDETATRLLAWMDDDPYGFCYQLEKGAANAFDKPGLVAFEKQSRARFDAAARAKPAPDGSFRDRPEYVCRRWGEVLRTLYVAQKNVAAYIALAEETGLTAQDCHAVATLPASRRKPEEALPWDDRGIDLDKKTPHGSMAAHDLARLKRELLTRLGRRDETLEAAWAEYRKHPSKYTYGDLMKFVPKARRAACHQALTLMAVRFASLPATPAKSYGYHRLEILTALLNGSLLILISGAILVQAFRRFMDPVPIRSGLMTGIALIGLLANLAGLAILSHTHESLNIRGARMHLIGEALSSGGVLLAGVGSAVTGWQRIDPIVGGLIAVVIVVGAARLLRDRFGIVHTTPQIESRAYQELGDVH